MSKSWGTELWDQLSALEKFTEKGIDFLDNFNRFVRERQKIEMDYAAQLKRLVKSYSPKRKDEEEYKIYSSLRTFKGVLQEVGSIANQHELVAENMVQSVFNEVVKLRQELKKERMDHLHEAKQEDAHMEKSRRKLDSCKSQYRSAHEAWLQAKILFEKADSDDNRTKAEVERAKSTMEQKDQFREKQKNEYILQLKNTNEDQQEHYSSKLPTIFNKLQAMEERRITCLGKYYETYADCHKKVLPVIAQCLDDIQVKHGQAVTPAEDSQALITKFETGNQPPKDLPMMDLDEPGGRGQTQTLEKDNVSIGSQNGANSLPGRGKAPKNKKGVFGTIFSSKKDELPSLPASMKLPIPHPPTIRRKERGRLSGLWASEEAKDFSHLPPNQQKQKLQGKIDEIQGKIDQEVKQKEALLKMRDVYTANNSLGDPNSLNKQLETIGKKIDLLRLELNTYQEFKDKADGKGGTPSQKSSPTRSSGPPANVPNSPSKERPPSSPLSPLEHEDSFIDDDDFDEDEGTAADPKPVGTCTAMYEFNSDDPNLLNMVEGEVLDVIEKDSGDGWTRVRRSDNSEGYVPTSYVNHL